MADPQRALRMRYPHNFQNLAYGIPAIEKYAHCLCLHVKPTTIFIAVFKLIRALLFASILLNTEFSFHDQPNELDFNPAEDGHRSTGAAVSILTRIIMASASAVAIYAVISGRAALLMPLYSMLLIDFFFALPSFYTKDTADSSFADSLSDFRSYSPAPSNLDDQYTRYSVFVFSTLIMIIKIYFLCVIWKCYRYLRLIELIVPIRLSEMHSQFPRSIGILGPQSTQDLEDMRMGHNQAPPPYDSIAAGTKPPNYEEAIKSCNIYSINIQPYGPTNHQLPNYTSTSMGPPVSNISTHQTCQLSDPTPTPNPSACNSILNFDFASLPPIAPDMGEQPRQVDLKDTQMHLGHHPSETNPNVGQTDASNGATDNGAHGLKSEQNYSNQNNQSNKS